jgi:hypothetical protein
MSQSQSQSQNQNIKSIIPTSHQGFKIGTLGVGTLCDPGLEGRTPCNGFNAN